MLKKIVDPTVKRNYKDHYVERLCYVKSNFAIEVLFEKRKDRNLLFYS